MSGATTDVEGYLDRLGLTERPPATLEGLRAVHRAHVARITYDNFSIMLGRPDPVDPVAAVGRDGLGEGFAEPLPLVRGDQEVEGWSFGIGAGYGSQAAGRPTGPAAWTYRHLPGGVLRGIVVTSRDHSGAAIDAAHRAWEQAGRP